MPSPRSSSSSPFDHRTASPATLDGMATSKVASQPGDRLIIDLAVGETDRDALRQALLRARATELAEVRRLEVRLSAGYGDGTTRAAMAGELDRARRRLAMLERLLDEIRKED